MPIYKYPISSETLLPKGKLLSIQYQKGTPVAWVQTNDYQPAYYVIQYATGQTPALHHTYFTTLQAPDGLVWHFYYELI